MTTQISAQSKAFQAIVVPLALAGLGVYTIFTAIPASQAGQIISGSGLLILALFAFLRGSLLPSAESRKVSPLLLTVAVAGLILVVAGVFFEQFHLF